MKPSRVVVVGLGPIGIAAAKAVIEDPHMILTGLVDVDPAKIGQPAADLSGGPAVAPTLAEALAGRTADVAIVTTTSRFDRIATTLRECMGAGLHVATSCEEMAWPRYRHPDLSDQVDQEARRAGVAMVGTGVNPGFVMDLLPAVLSSMVLRVGQVRCVRRVDASTRRRPLQQKVGATMTPDQFRALARDNAIGHQGLAESVALVAAALGRTAKPGSVTVTLDPVLADRETPSALGPIRPGQVCGMRNVGRWADPSLSIELDLTMAVGLADPKDTVDLDGPVPLSLEVKHGTPGDTATVAALVNAARKLPRAQPGLLTMLDLPPLTARS